MLAPMVSRSDVTSGSLARTTQLASGVVDYELIEPQAGGTVQTLSPVSGSYQYLEAFEGFRNQGYLLGVLIIRDPII